MFVKTSTPEEWIAQGEYYAKHQCWKVRSGPGAGLRPSEAVVSSHLPGRSPTTALVVGLG